MTNPNGISLHQQYQHDLSTIHSSSAISADSGIQNIQDSLIETFQQICSVEQMDLCQKLGMLSKSEQQQAYKMAKALIEHRQLPASPEDWSHLTEWVLTLRDRYASLLEVQCIRQHANDLERIGHLDEVQRLSSLLDEYGQAHDDLTDLLIALKKLRNDWKHRKRDVENIVLSILSSSSILNKNYSDYRVIKITRSHLTTLGLGFSSIGKYYIVYEPSMSEESKKKKLIDVAKDFSMVFQENAAQNLARMAGSYHRIFQQEEAAGDIDVIEQIQLLSQKVYIARPKSIILPYPTSLPTPDANRRESTFLERRKSIIILEEEKEEEGGREEEGEEYDETAAVNKSRIGNSPMVFNMAQPLFEPAGWDWPHILKCKHPRTRNGISGNSHYWCKQALTSTASFSQQNQNSAIINDNTGIWSTSVSRLADHFTKVGQDYYSNMLNNARLMHSHRAQMFEFATHSLLKTYKALQLEQGCANLNRALVFLYRLQQEAQRP